MKPIFRFLLMLALLWTVLPQAPGYAAPQAQPLEPTTAIRLRIGITRDGIVQIGPADLAAAGVAPETVDPRTFALSSLGQPVAIRVTGETDGRFDPEDRLFFFGQQFRGPEMDQKYTDERVYWLDIGGAPGPRIAEVDATPRGDLTPPADFPATVHAEESVHWWTLHTLSLDTEDTWFWDRLQPVGTGNGITHTLAYTVPYPAAGYTATLRLEEISRTSTAHRTTLGLNAVPLSDVEWTGKARRVFAAEVPAGVLASGTNTVTVGAINPAGVTADDIYVNYWELDYRREFRAWGDQLDFRAEAAGAREYEVSGFTSGDVHIWDVSDPRQPRRLVVLARRVFLPLISTGVQLFATGSPASGQAQSPLRFRTLDQAGTRYWLQAAGAVQGPTSIRMQPPTGLRKPAGGADAVIVTPTEFMPAAKRLAQWHSAHGRRAVIADIQDVYDEFNDGIYHPKAVTAMLAWSQTHWAGPPPAYLTLLGDGHWNFKGFNPVAYPPEPNPIPPYLAWVDPWQGEVPADTQFGDLDGDGSPEVAVGRLAVRTVEEAQVVVDKIIAYDEGTRSQTWQRQAVFVADNADSAGDFPAVSESIINNYLPADLTPQRIYLGITVPNAASARAAISDALHSGAWMLQFTGHGSVERWTHEQIWTTADIPGLHNGERLPVVMTFNCLDGYFAYPGRPSIAEMMQRQAGGGSIAAISPSGLGLTPDQTRFREILMTVMFGDGVREIGRALMLAKQRYYAEYGPHYLIDTMTLFGEPALRLPTAAAPGGTATGRPSGIPDVRVLPQPLWDAAPTEGEDTPPVL